MPMNAHMEAMGGGIFAKTAKHVHLQSALAGIPLRSAPHPTSVAHCCLYNAHTIQGCCITRGKFFTTTRHAASFSASTPFP